MSADQTYRFPFASYPAVRLVLLFAAGIAADAYMDKSFLWWFCFFGSCIFFYILWELMHRRTLKTGSYRLAIGCYLCSIVCFGGVWHALLDNRDVPAESQIIGNYTWQELSFKGEVYRIKPSGPGSYQVDVAVDTTVFPQRLSWDKPYNLRVHLDTDDTPFPRQLGLGDRLDFTATVYPLEPPCNPRQFDYKQFLASNNIYVQAGLKSIGLIGENERFFSWNRIRRAVISAVDQNFSHHTAPLAKALLLGYKNELNRETKTAFSRSGLSHIMAVSGLHVGFILAPFWVVIPLFWTFRYGKAAGLLILLMILFFYAGLTGFSASVIRASLTGGLLMYGRLFHKVRNSKNLTAVAALVILLMRPGDLFSIGFQLSFCAVYIILLVAPVINRTLPGWVRFRWYGTPVMAIIISFMVQAGLFPLLGYYFGEFSIVGPLTNALVIPVLGIIMPLALVLLPLAFGWPAIAQTLNTPVDFFFHGLQYLATTTAGWKWSWIQVHIESMLFFAIWMMFIFFIAALPLPRLRWKVLAVLLFLWCANQGKKLITKYQSAGLQLIVFDVGQGDATLLRTPAGSHYLIDTGRWRPGYNSAEYIIMPYMKAEGITHLDGVFLSHPHADHIGGMAALLNTIDIDAIYTSGSSHDSALFHTYRAIAAQKNIPVKSLRAGHRLWLDTGVQLFVYGPSRPAQAPSNVNNQSLILELVYGSTEFLFMGDAEREQERDLLKTYPRLVDTDFLKVAHHGSRTSSARRFLRAASPRIGVVSLDFRNQFNHPHEAAVRRLRNHIDKLYFTSLDGAIQLTSDGQRIWSAPETNCIPRRSHIYY